MIKGGHYIYCIYSVSEPNGPPKNHCGGQKQPWYPVLTFFDGTALVPEYGIVCPRSSPFHKLWKGQPPRTNYSLSGRPETSQLRPFFECQFFYTSLITISMATMHNAMHDCLNVLKVLKKTKFIF